MLWQWVVLQRVIGTQLFMYSDMHGVLFNARIVLEAQAAAEAIQV